MLWAKRKICRDTQNPRVASLMVVLRKDPTGRASSRRRVTLDSITGYQREHPVPGRCQILPLKSLVIDECSHERPLRLLWQRASRQVEQVTTLVVHVGAQIVAERARRWRSGGDPRQTKASAGGRADRAH